MNEIKKLLRNGLKENIYTAISICVIHKNKIILKDAVGYNDIQKKIPTDYNTLFDLASLTKIFVATAFMKMVEEKLLNLDTKLSVYLPEYKYNLKKNITFRHLLAHTSGLPSTFDLYTFNEWNKGNEYIEKKLYSTPLDSNLSTQYSCIGYMLLGNLMEKITGERLDQIINRYVSEPLSLKNIVYKPYRLGIKNIAITTLSRPNRGIMIPGVVHDGNAIALHNGISGNAGLFGTAIDIAILGYSFLNSSLLSETSIAEMTSLQNGAAINDRRGLGWKLYSDTIPLWSILSEKSYGHTGYTGTALWVDPNKELVISLLSNAVHYYKFSSDLEKSNKFRNDMIRLIIKCINNI